MKNNGKNCLLAAGSLDKFHSDHTENDKKDTQSTVIEVTELKRE